MGKAIYYMVVFLLKHLIKSKIILERTCIAQRYTSNMESLATSRPDT